MTIAKEPGVLTGDFSAGKNAAASSQATLICNSRLVPAAEIIECSC
jgi:hypothetical protein